MNCTNLYYYCIVLKNLKWMALLKPLNKKRVPYLHTAEEELKKKLNHTGK